MSHDKKYESWLEKISKGFESKEVLVYRGVPILKVKLGDNPDQIRYMSPLAANTQLEKVHATIDKIVDKEEKRAARRSVEKKSSDNEELTYFKKWENCQMELDRMKKREADILAQLKMLEARVEEISQSKDELQKEAAELRTQVKASQEMLKSIQKK